MQLCVGNCDQLWYHAYDYSCDLLAAPLTFLSHTHELRHSWHNGLRCLVGSDTESLENIHFHAIICNQHFWFCQVNKLMVTCPDPSSSRSGSYTLNIPLLTCLVIDCLCSAATVRLNPHCIKCLGGMECNYHRAGVIKNNPEFKLISAPPLTHVQQLSKG